MKVKFVISHCDNFFLVVELSVNNFRIIFFFAGPDFLFSRQIFERNAKDNFSDGNFF